MEKKPRRKLSELKIILFYRPLKKEFVKVFLSLK